MKCCGEGELMAFLDGQLSPREMDRVSHHISGCSSCREALDRLKREREATGSLLEAYRIAAEKGLQKADAGKIQAEPAFITKSGRKRKGVFLMFRKIMNGRRVLAAAAAAVLLICVFSSAPVRGFASQILQVFRVNRVQVLHFDPADVQELEKAMETYGKGVDIDSFGEVVREQVNDYAKLDVDTVRVGDLEISLPGRIGSMNASSELEIVSGERLSVTPRVEGINGFLANMGSKKLLPQALDGKTFVVLVPPVAARHYTTGDGDRVVLFRSTSPELRVPDGINVAEVREALLGIPVLPERMRNTLANIDPYSNTLLIPDFGMERNGSLREAKVNGCDGVFIESPEGASTVHNMLIWPQGGTWNALEGSFTLDRALELAGNIR